MLFDTLRYCLYICTVAPVRSSGVMSEDGDIDVESAEDVPDIAVEATATTAEDRSEVYSPTVSLAESVLA